MKRKPLTPTLATQWAQAAHIAYLSALMSASAWSSKQCVFHGGTSLHLSWNSSRYSEDLDFLLSREVLDIKRVSEKVLLSVREQFRALDAQFLVDIKDKSKTPARMIQFQLTVSHPDYIGNAMVKCEFWRTDAEYLQDYPTEFRTPVASGDLVIKVVNPVPAATLETAYADKLTAFATRPYLKWRDVYDLWWIGTQSSATLDVAQVARQFLHNVKAYTTVDGLSPANALRKFLLNDRAEIIAKADPELRRWLPALLWSSLRGEGVAQMVDYTFYALSAVANEIDPPSQARRASGKPAMPVDLKRIPVTKA